MFTIHLIRKMPKILNQKLFKKKVWESSAFFMFTLKHTHTGLESKFLKCKIMKLISFC